MTDTVICPKCSMSMQRRKLPAHNRNIHRDGRREQADRIAELESESAELRKVLAWYGDEGNYNRVEVFDILVGPRTPVANDAGQRAREAQRQGGK